MTLAERLAEAEAAESGPRKQVMSLQAAYGAAVAAADHAGAGRLEPQLAEARQELAIAEATVTALRTAQEALSREQAEKARAAELAAQRAGAQERIGEAIAAERLADAEGRDHVKRMYACLRAAVSEFRSAQESEAAVARAQRTVAEQRVLTGELEAAPRSMPGANFASVLAETDVLIRELLRWQGPVQQRAQRAPVSTTAAPAGSRGLTRPSPFGASA